MKVDLSRFPTLIKIAKQMELESKYGFSKKKSKYRDEAIWRLKRKRVLN
jgi:hypothetical protein